MSRKRRKLVVVNGKTTEVKTHGRGTLWKLFKEFLNSKKVNDTFTRKELLNSIYTVSMSSYENSIDIYRNNLTQLGFLEIISRGKYKKLYDFPNQITTTQVANVLTDKNTWKDWFITLHDKLGVDESVDLPKL